jgi:LacI family transcriptional regulator
VTIEDVAAEAGVSIATVSRVINGRYGVAVETSSKVQAVIDRLGYESSLVARSLRSRRTNVIGIIVHDLEPFSAELLKGAGMALHGTGYAMIVYSGGGHVGDHAGWERRYLSRLNGTLTDGSILVTPTVVEVTSDVPLVAVDPNAGSSTLPTVDSQNLEGAVAATEYLIGLGHRRIGFLAGRPDLESARLREQGYRQALEQAGIDFDPDLVRIGGYNPDTADQGARQLLAMSPPPTAVFAANDLSAIHTIRVAGELGLLVPDDLSVVGFDNIPESALCEPPLTTIDQSIQDMGYAAVRLLINLIETPGSSESTHLKLPTKLVVRQSCRPLTD